MRVYTGKSGFKITGRTWDETDNRLKATTLAPDRRARVARILAESKGEAKPSTTPTESGR